MNFKRVKPNIFLPNRSRLLIRICEIMSTDQGKWFHFLVYLSRGFGVFISNVCGSVYNSMLRETEVEEYGFVLKLIRFTLFFQLEHLNYVLYSWGLALPGGFFWACEIQICLIVLFSLTHSW